MLQILDLHLDYRGPLLLTYLIYKFWRKMFLEQRNLIDFCPLIVRFTQPSHKSNHGYSANLEFFVQCLEAEDN